MNIEYCISYIVYFTIFVKMETIELSNFKYPEHPLCPRRLTMMCSYGICQFCNNPEGTTNSMHINMHFDCTNLLGFYSCNKDECVSKLHDYVKNMRNYIFNSHSWKNIIYKAVNQSFISVPRSNGDIDTDWNVVMKTKYNSEYNEIASYPLNQLFYTAILASEKYDLIINKLPQELWIYIHDICIASYNKQVHLIFDFDKPYVLMRRDAILPEDKSIQKLVSLDTY